MTRIIAAILLPIAGSTAPRDSSSPMPRKKMRAEFEVRRCDLCLVLGSSLVVYPAAGLPITAKHSGARLAILNREPTDQDSLADLVVHDEIGPALSEAVPTDA